MPAIYKLRNRNRRVWLGSSIQVAILSPDLPRSRTRAPETLEFLLVFECVHATPESIVRIANELLLLDESLEWLNHEFLACSHVVKDLFAKDEVTAIYPYGSISDWLNSGNQARVGVAGDNVIAQVRQHTQETGDSILATEVVKLTRKGKIGKTITIDRKELFFAVEILLDGFQPLSNV